MNECERLRRSEQVMALNQADIRGAGGGGVFILKMLTGHQHFGFF